MSVPLGHVRVPSGVLACVDAGLMHLWCHDRPPEMPPGVLASPEVTADVNRSADLHLRGRDAEACGLAYARSHHPLYVYDTPGSSVEAHANDLRAFARERGYSVEVVVLRPQVPHLTRAHHLLTRSAGGSVQFHGVWASVSAGLPTDRELPVVAEHHDDPELADRWQRVCVVAREGRVARAEPAGWVMVDRARLMFCDLDRLGRWNDHTSIDGLADLAFWGRDEASVAAEVGAPPLANGRHRVYGWRDLPVDDALARARQLGALREAGDRRFAFDFRPHTHHWLAMEQVRASDTQSGVVELDGAAATVFMTTWGDGVWQVHRDLDAHGELLRVRLELGTDATAERLRSLSG